jgi:hypothetical protein
MGARIVADPSPAEIHERAPRARCGKLARSRTHDATPTPIVTLETPRLQREHRTMTAMVGIYCRGHHGAGAQAPCTECREFLGYAERRLEKCPYGEAKPTCARCPIHCYKPAQREHAKVVMRYAGPRMPRRHPWLALLHVLDKLRRVEHPMEVRRRGRS